MEEVLGKALESQLHLRYTPYPEAYLPLQAPESVRESHDARDLELLRKQLQARKLEGTGPTSAKPLEVAKEGGSAAVGACAEGLRLRGMLPGYHPLERASVGGGHLHTGLRGSGAGLWAAGPGWGGAGLSRAGLWAGLGVCSACRRAAAPPAASVRTAAAAGAAAVVAATSFFISRST